jgi:hypothetical protein
MYYGLKSWIEAARKRLHLPGSSPQPLSCDFPDQPRDDVALGLFGCLQLFQTSLIPA